MKNFNSIKSLAMAVTLASSSFCPISATAPSQKPNVLFIFADQLRASVMGYEGDVNSISMGLTKNFDKFSTESVNFENSISVFPVCSPARASFLTGLYPHTTMPTNDIQLNPDINSIGKILKQNNYQTGYIGKWHVDGYGREMLIPAERRQGFDFWRTQECTHSYNASKYFDENDNAKIWPEYDSKSQTETLIDFIKNGNKDRPFAYYLSWGPPHDPYDTAPQKYKDMVNVNNIVLNPNVPQFAQSYARTSLAGYYAHTAALDDYFGQIITALKEEGLYDNTIIIFTADHGDTLGAHGYTLKRKPYDEAVRVPFLIKYPNSPVKKISQPVETPDYMPTILDLCGIEVPPDVQGESLLPLINETGTKMFDGALYQNLIVNDQKVPNADLNLVPDIPEGRGYITERYTYFRDKNQGLMLFDNISDKYQQNNLIDNPLYADIVSELDSKLSQKMAYLGDKFLNIGQLNALLGVKGGLANDASAPYIRYMSKDLKQALNYGIILKPNHALTFVNAIKTPVNRFNLTVTPILYNGKILVPKMFRDSMIGTAVTAVTAVQTVNNIDYVDVEESCAALGKTIYNDQRGFAVITDAPVTLSAALLDEIDDIYKDPGFTMINGGKPGIAPTVVPNIEKPTVTNEIPYGDVLKEWTFENDNHGLTFKDIDAVIEGGVLKCTATGADAQLRIENLNFNMDEATHLIVTMKTPPPIVNSTPFSVYCGNSGTSAIVSSKIEGSLVVSDNYVDYAIRLANSDWSGMKQYLRIDAIDPSQAGRIFYVKSIKLMVEKEKPVVKPVQGNLSMLYDFSFIPTKDITYESMKGTASMSASGQFLKDDNLNTGISFNGYTPTYAINNAKQFWLMPAPDDQNNPCLAIIPNGTAVPPSLRTQGLTTPITSILYNGTAIGYRKTSFKAYVVPTESTERSKGVSVFFSQMLQYVDSNILPTACTGIEALRMQDSKVFVRKEVNGTNQFVDSGASYKDGEWADIAFYACRLDGTSPARFMLCTYFNGNLVGKTAVEQSVIGANNLNFNIAVNEKTEKTVPTVYIDDIKISQQVESEDISIKKNQNTYEISIPGIDFAQSDLTKIVVIDKNNKVINSSAYLNDEDSSVIFAEFECSDEVEFLFYNLMGKDVGGNSVTINTTKSFNNKSSTIESFNVIGNDDIDVYVRGYLNNKSGKKPVLLAAWYSSDNECLAVKVVDALISSQFAATTKVSIKSSRPQTATNFKLFILDDLNKISPLTHAITK